MRILRRSKAQEILLELSRGPKHVRELIEEVGGSALTVESRLAELKEAGLIQEEQHESWPFRRHLALTDKGEEVAKLLRAEGDFLKALEKGRAIGAIFKDRWKWMLALLRAVGGEVRGSTKLTKLFFLLKRECGVGDVPYDFSPYMFGPYSAELLGDALDLGSAGFLEVECRVYEPTLAGDVMIERNYRLTEKGGKKADELLKWFPPEIRDAMGSLKKFNEMELTELLRHVYSKYPEECGPQRAR